VTQKVTQAIETKMQMIKNWEYRYYLCNLNWISYADPNCSEVRM